VDARAACCMGGVMGAARGMTEVGDAGVAEGQTTWLLGVAVGPPTFVLWAVGPPVSILGVVGLPC
jgi:hypothetical protein